MWLPASLGKMMLVSESSIGEQRILSWQAGYFLRCGKNKSVTGGMERWKPEDWGKVTFKLIFWIRLWSVMVGGFDMRTARLWNSGDVRFAGIRMFDFPAALRSRFKSPVRGVGESSKGCGDGDARELWPLDEERFLILVNGTQPAEDRCWTFDARCSILPPCFPLF